MQPRFQTQLLQRPGGIKGAELRAGRKDREMERLGGPAPALQSQPDLALIPVKITAPSCLLCKVGIKKTRFWSEPTIYHLAVPFGEGVGRMGGSLSGAITPTERTILHKAAPAARALMPGAGHTHPPVPDLRTSTAAIIPHHFAGPHQAAATE